MGLLIFLRQDEHISYFRRALRQIIRTPGVDRLILGSGYIWEYLPRDKNHYSILDDDLLQDIKNAGINNMTVIAGKFSGLWLPRYKVFIKKLRDNGINVTAYKARGNNWHAKVAMCMIGDIALAGIIGSSNLTRPAFGEGNNRFNHEADVLIWQNQTAYNKHFRSNEFIEAEKMQMPLGPIDLILNPDSKQMDEVIRLQELYREITHTGNLRLLE